MNKYKALLTACGLVIVCVAAIACDDTTEDEELDIIGSYTEAFGTHVITEDTWTINWIGSDPFVFLIAEFSNDEQFVVAKNDPSNEWSPGMWSVFEWTWDGEDLYYCQTIVDAETQEEAKADQGKNADPTNLETGCNDYNWTQLILEV